MIRKLVQKLQPKSLGTALITYMFLALLAAVLCNNITYNGIVGITGLVTDRKNYYEKHMERTMEDLQSYITDNDVTLEDMDKIEEWNYENWHVYLMIYHNNKIYFNTLYSDGDFIKKDGKSELSGEEQQEIDSKNSEVQSDFGQYNYKNNMGYRHVNSRKYSLKFKDAEANILVRAFFEAKFQTIILLFSMASSTLCFVIVFLVLFKNKLMYIKQIERGIKIIENGSMEYIIQEKGKDELNSLAASINEMTVTLKEQMDLKEEIQKENNEIVTAISHDIRTPLTSIICYLDLITDKKYENSEQLEQYTMRARKQAYYMKKLMDDLFAHSLICNRSTKPKTEKYNGNELLSQLLGESSFLLQEQGYEVREENEVTREFTLEADISGIKRIFDNLCSNIIKYAVKEEPILFFIKLEGENLIIIQKNRFGSEESSAESYGIGMKTCRKIIEEHGGIMKISTVNQCYEVKMTLHTSTEQLVIEE